MKKYLCRSSPQYLKAGLWALTGKLIIHSLNLLVQWFLVPDRYVPCWGKQAIQKETSVQMYLSGICLIKENENIYVQASTLKVAGC